MLFSLCSVFAQEGIEEYHLKAVFLERFTRFVVFTEAMNPEEGSFYITIYGKNPFGKVLDEIYKDKLIQDKIVEIRYISDLDQITSSGILFVCEDKAGDLPQISRMFAGKGLLLIGDTPGMASKGAVINMIVKDFKIRYEINPRAAENYSLKIDRLLLSNAVLIDAL